MDKYINKKLEGRYEIKELIGVGGMANVYKAFDIVDEKIVAVKILRDEFAENEEFIKRFKTESKAISVLSHPNIVKVFDVTFTDRIQSIVMEYVDGITLKKYIEQQGILKWKEAVHFTVQILRALQHAHDKGIIHRDIKPQNIMLQQDGTIKVMDFGIARFNRTEPITATDKVIGSVHYISPEQARGEITDEKTDVYAIGVMLFEMLTGKLPFEATDPVSVALMQISDKPQLPREINPSIPEGLEDITIRAMQKDVSLRYQTASEMLRDIEEFKKNPHIQFDYTHFNEAATVAINKINSQSIQKTDDEVQEPVPSKKKSPVMLVLAGVASVLLVFALVFGVFMVINMINEGNSSTITVPNLVGVTLDQAKLDHPEMK
ncbi:MAG: protein kinase, partial [Oscillospiraceae bacterium]